MNIKPLGDKVLVREDVQPEKLGGIYLPSNVDTETWEPQSGVVVGVGDDWLKHPDAKMGDRVFYDAWRGRHEELDGVGYRLLERDEVLAVMEE